MRLVLDLQAAQASNRARGIGRYSLALAQAMARQYGDGELLIALNGALEDTVEPVREAFRGLLPDESIRVWWGMKGVRGRDGANDWRRLASERLRESFLASLAPDVVFTSSLFEGFDDDAVTGVGSLRAELATAVTIYDLIPLVHRETYLRHPALEKWYLGKLAHLQRAELWLAISEHSRREAIEHLGLPEEQVVTIAGAADARFAPTRLSVDRLAAMRARYGLADRFVMYTGGIDHRKNVDGLMRAYALLPAELRQRHCLLIVCHAEEAARRELERARGALGLGACEVVFPGFVPDDDLVALYSHCAAFVFPSWHEGFGLPALEAMACGAPVLAANATSLPEVVGRTDALFDPHDPADIAAKLVRTLADEAYNDVLRTHALKRAAAFSWDKSARQACQAIEGLARRRRETAAARVSLPRSRPQLIMVTPLPPQRTGIADYAADFLPALARHYDIDVVVDEARVHAPATEASCRIRSLDWFKANADRCERIVYQLGNSHFHKHMPELLEQHPGVVVLHDFFLSGLFFHLEMNGIAPGAWTRALYESHGYHGLAARFSGGDARRVMEDLPANFQVLRNAEGIIMHSEFGRELAEQWYAGSTGAGWAIVHQAHSLEAGPPRARARQRLGISDGDFLVCSFGIIAPTKLNHRLLQAWLDSRLRTSRRTRLVFVGDHHDSDYGRELARTISKAGLASRVTITGFCSDADYRLWLAAADVAVQLRQSTRGETSRAALDCAGAGVALIVNAHGTMRDLSMVQQVPDAFADEDLVRALEHLWSDRDACREIGARARAHIRHHHAPRVAAERFAAAIEQFQADGRRRLLASIAGLGNAPAGQDNSIRLSQAIARSLPCRMPARQLLVDVSRMAAGDLPKGLLARAGQEIRSLITLAPTGVRPEAVRAGEEGSVIYARAIACRLLGLPDHLLPEDAWEFTRGDIYLNPFPGGVAEPCLRHFRACGGLAFRLLDLLPADGAGAAGRVQRIHLVHALQDLGNYDGVLCASRETALALVGALDAAQPSLAQPLRVGFLADPTAPQSGALSPPASGREGAAVPWRTLIEMLTDPAHRHWLGRWHPSNATTVPASPPTARVA